jgi:sulfonate transport system substrate-binding protein
MAGTDRVVVAVNSGACRRIGPDALRIGYQKGSVSMVLAKSHQLLEKRYPQTKISWIEFPAGPQMLEALNIGSIDLGSTGDIPPIFAQAAGADLVYVGVEPPKPKAEVILVPKNSPIRASRSLKDIKSLSRKGPAPTIYCSGRCNRPD